MATDPLLHYLEGNSKESRRAKLLYIAWKYERGLWRDDTERYRSRNPQRHAEEATTIPQSIERLGDLRRRQARGAVLLRYDENRALVSRAISCETYQMRTTTGVHTLSALTSICRSWDPIPMHFNAEKEMVNASTNTCKRCDMYLRR